MRQLAHIVVRLRVIIILIALAATAGLGLMLPRLEADDDVMQFLPGDDPDVKLFRRVNQRFGGLDVAIVGLESDALFTPDRLTAVRKLTRSLASVDGVFDVMSFTEVPDPRPSPFGLVVEPLVDRVPTEAEELAALREHVLANENAVGNLVSADGKAAMVLCFLGGKRPPIHVAADIRDKALEVWGSGGIYFGGAPFIRLHVAGGTKEDIHRLTPLVAAVVTLITFLIFRRPLGVVLSLGIVGMALVWLMGLLALRGKGITVVGSGLPTLLVAIGGAYGIHILGAYFGGKAPTVRERVVEAMSEVGAPVLVSVLTTCVGFLSFLAMDVEPMREFGASAAIGVGFTGLMALTVIPAALSFSRRVPRALGTALLARPLGRLGGLAARHRLSAIAIAVVLGLAGLAGVTRIAPDATLKSFFREGSEPDLANAFLERHFGGSVYLQIYFEGDMRSPFVLAELRKVVEHARGMEEVEQVSSIIDPLVMMSEAMGGRADLPVNRDRTRSLYPFLSGSAAIDQVVADEKDAGLVQIRIKAVGPERVASAVAELIAFVEAEIPRAVRGVELGQVPEEERAGLRQQMNIAVSKRVLRLTRMHGGPPASEESLARVNAVLSLAMDERLEPGLDLEKALAKLVEEHVVGDSAPFEEPLPEVGEQELAEWQARGDQVAARLSRLALAPAGVAEVREAVREAMPLTSARDPEGLDLTAGVVANSLRMAQARVRAGRLAGQVLRAAGTSEADEQLRERVAWAITDLDAPAFGFPDLSGKGSPVLARVTGYPVINAAFCESTIRNQLRSLALALVVLTLLLSVALRSVMTAVKALAPAVFMLAGSVGVMGVAGIPLDLTTSMIAAIALGIGVDYSIHFLWRRRHRGESLETTTGQVGPSIASNAVQVAAGFAVMSLSDMVPMQRFGLLVAMTMLLASVATFVLLPALRAEGATALSREEEEERIPSSPRT